MKLTFLGTGDAFATSQGHNSVLLEFEETNLCIDFPSTNRESLIKLNKELGDIKNLFISHVHEDHINGFQQLAHFHSIVTKEKPNLYANETVMEMLWETAKGLQSPSKGKNSLEDYFNVIKLKENETFKIGKEVFQIVKTDHMIDMPSYGLINKGNFYFSCDSNLDELLLRKINKDVKKIFHDCHMWNLKIDSHASLEDLKTLPIEIQDKIILMHYQDGFARENVKEEFNKKSNMKLATKLEIFEF